MPKRIVEDILIKNPNLLVIVKTPEDDQHAFPVRKDSLAHYSPVFADMISLSIDKEEEHIYNGWPDPYHQLEVLENLRDSIKNTLRYLFPECKLPQGLSHGEVLGVYRVADKYGMQRLCDWMRERIV